MVETNDENDPFEEDIVFDQTGLLGSNHPYSRQQQIPGFLPTFLLFIRTVFLCIVFVSLGLCASISLGPIIHIEIAVGLPVAVAFHTFTAHSVGMLIGGLLGSKLFEIYNRQFLIFVSLVWMAVSIAVLPFTIPVSFWWTLTTLLAIGAGMAFIFTGSNVLCLDLWGKQGSASMQTLHFSFAVGAFIAPIVIHPLLLGPYLPQINGVELSKFNVTTNKLGVAASNERVTRSVVNNVSAVNYNENNFAVPTELKLPFGVNLDSLTLPIPSKINVTSGGINNSTYAELLNSANVNNRNLENTPNSNETMGSSPKPVNRKPAFTNANLLPDQTPWKNPSKKVRLDQSHSLLAAVTPVNMLATTTIVLHEITNNLTIENSTASSIFNNATQISLNRSNNDQTLINTPVKDVSGTNNENNFSTKDSILVDNETTLTTTSVIMTTMVTLNNVTPIPETHMSPTDGKYVIDFSNHSESEGSDIGHEAMDDEFSDYTTNSKSYNDPQLMDLKESSVHESANNESSAITVTVSFHDNEMSTHHQFQSKPGTYSNITDSSLHPLQSIVNKFKNYGVTSLHFVYICTGILILFIAIISICIMCHNPREPRSRQEESIQSNLQRASIRFFIFLFTVYMFAAEALQGAVLHLIASTQTENGMPVISKNFGGQTLFWGLVCSMRFLCILASGCLKLKPGKILVVATLFMVMGTIFLCIGTFNKLDFLWGGIVVVALGLAPVLPTGFLWMAEQMKVTHKMCALMIIVSSFGNSLTHTTLTHVTAKSHLYSYVLIGISVFALIFLTLSFILLIKTQPLKELTVQIGYHLANQDEDDSMELTRPNAKNFDNINRRLSDMGEAAQALLID